MTHPPGSALAGLTLRLATLGRKRRAVTPRRRVALGEAFTWDNLTAVRQGGRLEPATGRVHPHVLLKIRRSVFTSVCLVLEKPAR